MGTRKNGRARRRHARGEEALTPCVSPARAPVLSLARYFQAPATQATRVFDYFVVIEIAFMDNQAQITETISRLDSEKVR